MRLALTCLLFSLGCEEYLAPPSIAGLSVEAGVYDPEGGPLEVRLSGPVDLATLSLSMFVDTRGKEGELCLGSPLPTGCTVEAARVLGPCDPRSSPSMRTEDGKTRFTCIAGGALLASADRSSLQLELEGKLIPFERYTIALAPGLTSAEGADTGVASEARFSVKSDIERGPTTFQAGMFFAVVDIFEPIPAQFHFWFWFAVKPETGQLFIYAADADPKDPMATDPKSNRIPSDWTQDPQGMSGAVLSATGQVADVDGQRLIRLFPFQLLVIVPPVEALATEVNARVSMGQFMGAPALEREIIDGTMSSPAVFLGLDSERAALGPGRGAIAMFRLAPEETPPLSSLLGRGVTEDDLLNPVFGE